MGRLLSSFVSVCLTVAFAAIARAQDGAESEADVFPSWALIAITVVGGGVMLAGALGWLSALQKKLGDLASLAAEKSGVSFLSHLDEVLVGYAVDLYNSEIKAAKEASADGKLTAEEKARFMSILIATTKRHFGLVRLAGLVASGDDKSIEAAIRARAEVAILEAKSRGQAVKPVDPTSASPQV